MSTKIVAPGEPTGPVPAAAYIRIDQHHPYIVGHRCTQCGASYTRVHTGCPQCTAVESMAPFKAGGRGHLVAYSVVTRSYPGVKVPFVSAVVQLEDGLVLKGVLEGVPFDPVRIAAGMSLRVVFGEVPGQKDAAGNAYIAYHFVPEKD